MKTQILALVGVLAAGCGAVDSSSLDDPELLGADGKADSASSTSTYYTMRPDLRKCAFPLCGGTFVKRVNQPETKCLDGSWADECRVLDVDYSKLGFTDGELGSFEGSAVLVRGSIVKGQTVNGTTY